MKQKAPGAFVFAAAAVIAACGGGSTADPTTTMLTTSTVAPTTTVAAATTMPDPTTTVAATTTTVARTTKDFPYEIVPMDVAPYDPSVEWGWASVEDSTPISIPQHAVMYDSNGDYLGPIPDDGTYPIDGTNPNNPEAINMREYSLLPAGTKICIRGGAVGGGDGNYTVDEITEPPYVSPSAVLYQRSGGGAKLAILVRSENGGYRLNAAEIGLINYPSGIWSPWLSVEEGRC